jgi:hypothetical protein
MAENDDLLEDDNDDFEKLLDSFINSKFDDEDNTPPSAGNAKEKLNELKDNIADEQDDDDDDDEEDNDFVELSPEGKQISKEMEEEDLDKDLVSSFNEAKKVAEEHENQPTLGSDESELAQAFVNFYTSVNKLSNLHLKQEYQCEFNAESLYPNYKPYIGNILSSDLINGWLLLVKIFPKEIGSFPPSSTDEEFLNFAEKITNQDLQLAVISYVEILIDIESCELAYQAKLAKYQERHIKRIMYEEYLARKERQRKFTEAVSKKNFPIDADRLISGYFRVAQKDPDGAFQALTKNPATFAPIDFSKIKPRFFGLIKVSPKDGIRVNMEIGNFLKNLKV